MPSVYPLTVFLPEQQAHYAHMAKRDVELWERFLRDHGSKFYGFSYDVALGGRLPQLAEDIDRATAVGYQYSTALKIDAVGWMSNQAWIIEVRPEATVSAYGSAVVYALVARREKLTELPVIPTIVCESCQLDVEWAAQMTGIQVIKVPPQ
jgi:hypothetical protein